MLSALKNLFNTAPVLGEIRGIIDEVVTNKEEKAEIERKMTELLQSHQENLLKAENEDRDSARNREIETSKAGSGNFTHNVLAYVGVISFFAIIGYVLSKGLGKMAAEESFIIGNLTGLAGAIAKDIYGYYFGSSKAEHDTQNWIKKEDK
jgi:hypothetical protein